MDPRRWLPLLALMLFGCGVDRAPTATRIYVTNEMSGDLTIVDPHARRTIGRVALGDLGRVDVWWLASYGGGVFLPLRDGSAGAGTYGGGRYLLDTVKGADLGSTGDRLVVDLNFAYQPSCAYDEAWACPLPGPTNTVAVPLPVGERYRAPGDHGR